MIDKAISDEDNRVHEISITDHGKRIVQATQHIFNLLDESIFNGFGEEDLKSFMNYLDQIQRNISELDIEKIIIEGRKALETI